MNLDGIRVLDLTQLLPGPYGSQLLADAGAEVIKIEPPQGDPGRLFGSREGWAGHIFSPVNAGKKSVMLNLKTEEGKEIFYRLVEDADVVFEQFRPGVTERLEIDYETLVEYNDELVYCSLTGYGQDGPYADRAGHDLNYIGIAGLLDMSRADEDELPTQPGYPIADMTGGLVAAKSIVSALLSRELGNSDGEYLDIAMTDAVLSYAQVEIAMADDGDSPRPGGTPIAGSVPWYSVYETADGEYMTVAALEPRFWRVFCEAVDREDLRSLHLTTDTDELAYLRDELRELFATATQEEWCERFAAVPDGTVEPVNTPTEALTDPQMTARNLFAETDVGHRRVRHPGTVGLSTQTTSESEDLPALGEHTDAVLNECGYDADELDRLREQDVI